MAENNKDQYKYFYFCAGSTSLVARTFPIGSNRLHSSWVNVSHLSNDHLLADMLYPSLGNLFLLWEGLEVENCDSVIKIKKDSFEWWEEEDCDWKSFKFKMKKGPVL